MKLADIVKSKKSSIARQWREEVLATYPPDVTRFLAKQKDPFANPVGHTLSQGLSGLLDILAGEEAEKDEKGFLEDMMRMRAVQDFSPAQAVGFLFSLKKILRERLKAEKRNPELSEAWQEMDEKIDAMALAGFNAYQACREKLHSIRVNEVKNLSYRAMKRANLVCDLEELSQESGQDGKG